MFQMLQYLTHLALVTFDSWQESIVTNVSQETIHILAGPGLALSTHFMIPQMICGNC